MIPKTVVIACGANLFAAACGPGSAGSSPPDGVGAAFPPVANVQELALTADYVSYVQLKEVKRWEARKVAEEEGDRADYEARIVGIEHVAVIYRDPYLESEPLDEISDGLRTPDKQGILGDAGEAHEMGAYFLIFGTVTDDGTATSGVKVSVTPGPDDSATTDDMINESDSQIPVQLPRSVGELEAELQGVAERAISGDLAETYRSFHSAGEAE